MSNNLDKQYLDIMRDILENGVVKSDRTGTGTKSLFGRTIRHNMRDGFPLLTTKKLYTKGIIHELLWFLMGDTNVKYLQDNNVRIWDEWSDENGDLGPVYSKQWVNWGGTTETKFGPEKNALGHLEKHVIEHKGINQIQNAIDMLNNDPDSRRIMVNAWNVGELDDMALMPCFNKNTLIKTDNGYKYIDKVNVGDLVLNSVGNYEVVDEIHKNEFNGEMYNIKVWGNTQILESTPEHPFLVKDGGLKNAKDLTLSDYLGIPINKKSVIPTFEITKQVNQYSSKSETRFLDDKNDWFVMGYFLGDGWLIKDDKIFFTIADNDINTVLPIIRKSIKVVRHKKSGKNCTKFSTSNKMFYHILSQFGNGAKNKIIPDFIHDAPKNLIIEFINGYLSADGCYTESGISYTTISEHIAYGLQLLYAKIGVKASIYKQVRPKTTVIEGRVVNQNDTFSINVYKNKYKSSKYILDENYLWLKVRSIDINNNYDDQVYNLSVSGDRTYTANNLAVHNCHYGFQLYTRELTHDERVGLAIETVGDKFKNVDFQRPVLLDNENIPKREVSMIYNMRSNDFLLGQPYNTASYGFLLEMFAQQTNMVAGELIANLGDTHLYDNHIEYAEEQLERDPYKYDLPKLKLNKAKDIFSYTIDDFVIEGYEAYPNWTGERKPPIAV